jgi:hypothetical protein
MPARFAKECIMTLYRALAVTFALAMVVQPQLVRAEPRSPQSGLDEITVRPELLHRQHWAVDTTTVICLPKDGITVMVTCEPEHPPPHHAIKPARKHAHAVVHKHIPKNP